jgi:hypothetical protein
MKKILLGLLATTLIGTAAQTASAHERFGFEHNRIVVEAPALRFVTPPAVVCQAPVVCAPVVVAPAPVCVIPEPIVPVFGGPVFHHRYHGRW